MLNISAVDSDELDDPADEFFCLFLNSATICGTLG